MIRFFRRKTIVRVRAAAATKLHNIAQQAMPQETGGLLLGWWDGNDIIIEDCTEVIDDHATGNSWVRHEQPAQKSLDAILTDSKMSPIGYVGEWHSHPAVQGASATDLSSLRQSSALYEKPLVMIVRLPNESFDLHAARRGKMLSVQLRDL